MKEKLMNLLIQAFKFGIVGVLSTIIDFGLLYIFNDICDIYYLVASAMSFFISLIFNYLCSMKYVFKRKEDSNRAKEFAVFVTLSVIGLGLNELLLWIFVDKMAVAYMTAHGAAQAAADNHSMIVMVGKLFATVFVMIFNFVTRKIFIEDHSDKTGR